MNNFLFQYLFAQAEDCYEKKEFMNSLQYLNEAIFLSFSMPNKFISNTYEFRGIIKMRLNQYMGSIIDFNKAINFSPKILHYIFIVIYLILFYLNMMKR